MEGYDRDFWDWPFIVAFVEGGAHESTQGRQIWIGGEEILKGPEFDYVVCLEVFTGLFLLYITWSCI